MAYIKVDTDALGDSVKKLSKLQARMDNVQQRLSTLSGQIDWEIKGRQELENRINQLKSKIGSISADIGNTAYCLEQVSNEYITAQNDAKNQVEGLSDQVTPGFSSSATVLAGTGTALGVGMESSMYTGKSNAAVNIGPIFPAPCPTLTPTPAPAKTVSGESYFVSPPSEIEIAAYNSIDNRVNSLMKVSFYRPFPLEVISVYEYTFVKTFKNRIERQEATVEYRENIFEDIENLSIIWEIITGNFDPNSIGQPGISDIPNALNINKKLFEKININTNKLEYLEKSIYKYLVFDNFARNEFFSKLTALKKEIESYPIPEGIKEKTYKNAMLDRIEAIININKDYKQSVKDMFYILDNLSLFK